MTTLTQTNLGGWRIDTADGTVTLTSAEAQDAARRILRLPRIERYGPAPVEPALA